MGKYVEKSNNDNNNNKAIKKIHKKALTWIRGRNSTDVDPREEQRIIMYPRVEELVIYQLATDASVTEAISPLTEVAISLDHFRLFMTIDSRAKVG